MKITIEDTDRLTLLEALQAQIRFWFSGRNATIGSMQDYARREVRSAIRLLRAARRAK